MIIQMIFSSIIIYQHYLRFLYKLNLRKNLLIIDRLLRRRVGRGAKVTNKKRHAVVSLPLTNSITPAHRLHSGWRALFRLAG